MQKVYTEIGCNWLYNDIEKLISEKWLYCYPKWKITSFKSS